MIICLYSLVLKPHLQINFILHVGILDFKGTMFLFCRLLPCVSKMFIYKEMRQVRDPQNLKYLEGMEPTRKSMKGIKAYDMLLHGNVLVVPLGRNMKYLCNSYNKYYVLTWSKVPYDFPYH